MTIKPAAITFRFFIAGAAFWGAAAVAQTTGYSIADDLLVQLELEKGAYIQLGTLPLAAATGAAMGKDGQIYAVSDLTNDLWRIAPRTLSASRVGPIGLDIREDVGLAFDACGRLWLINQQILYRLDPSSATPTQHHQLGRQVLALAGDGAHLIGIVENGAHNQLARIDPQQGTVTPFGDLVYYPTLQAGLDFDDSGRLWAVFWKNSPLPELWISSIVEYHPQTGQVLQTIPVPAADSKFVFGGNLAISRPRGSCLAAIDVPLSSKALAVFAFVLGVVATTLVRA